MEKRTPYMAFVLPCGALGTVWSVLARLAFLEFWSHNWNPNYPRSAWTTIQDTFGISAILFLPGGFLASTLCDDELISSAIGGAIEGALVGGLLALIAWAVAPDRGDNQ